MVQDNNKQHRRERRDAADVPSLSQRVRNMAANQKSILNTIMTSSAKANWHIAQNAALVTDTMSGIITANANIMQARTTTLLDAIAAATNAAQTTFPNTVNSFRADMTAQLSIESSARLVLDASLMSTATRTSTMASTFEATAAADRASIRTSRSAIDFVAVTNAQLSAATITENTRASNELATQSAAIAAARVTYGASLSTIMSTHARQSDGACVKLTNTIGNPVDVQLGGNDGQAWFVVELIRSE
jgi:hypothetical protein